MAFKKKTLRKLICYILLLTIGFLGCVNSTHKHVEKSSKDSLNPTTLDSTEQAGISNNESNRTVITLQDSLFKTFESELEEITSADFERYLKNPSQDCIVDSNGFPSRLRLSVTSKCDEICETFLIETSGERMLLPSNYDSGILDLVASPSCTQFIVYSSYDMPDFVKFYEHRAEIYIFTIVKDQGLKAIKPSFKFYSKDWSIENLTCLSDNSIAIKIYGEARSEDGIGYVINIMRQN